MSAEHRRQLLAFFIVALAAFLLIGNGLHSQPRQGHDQSRTPAAIAAGVTISTGPSGFDLGGSARGTTAIEPAAAPARSVTTTVTSSPLRAAPGHSDQARRADRSVQRSQSSAQKQATKRSARPGSDDKVTAQGKSAGGKKAHAKKHGKKHGKKAHKHHRHAR